MPEAEAAISLSGWPDAAAVLGADEHEHTGHADDDAQRRHPQVLHLFIVGKAEARGVQGRGGCPLRKPLLPAEGQVVDEVHDDHAEAQRDDGQIVALQPQGRNTHQQAQQGSGRTGSQNTQEQNQQEGRAGFFRVDPRPLKCQRDQCRRIRADGHKAAVPQRQLPQKTQNQIQRRRHDDEIAALPDGGRDLELDGIAAQQTHDGHRGKQQSQHREVDQITQFGVFHTFSPTFFPRIPAGRIISTTIRIRYTKVSDMEELI